MMDGVKVKPVRWNGESVQFRYYLYFVCDSKPRSWDDAELSDVLDGLLDPCDWIIPLEIQEPDPEPVRVKGASRPRVSSRGDGLSLVSCYENDGLKLEVAAKGDRNDVIRAFNAAAEAMGVAVE